MALAFVFSLIPEATCQLSISIESAEMNQYFDEIYVTFSAATDMGGLSVNEVFDCKNDTFADYTGNKLGTNAYCSFRDSETLIVFLDITDSTIEPDIDYIVISSVSNPIYPANSNGTQSAATGNILLTIDPDYIKSIEIDLDINDNSLNLCSNLSLNASLSQGNNYRDWSYIKWTVPLIVQANCIDHVNDESIFIDIPYYCFYNNSNTQNIYQSLNKYYQFNLYLENWLGYSKNITFDIFRNDEILESVEFNFLNQSNQSAYTVDSLVYLLYLEEINK